MINYPTAAGRAHEPPGHRPPHRDAQEDPAPLTQAQLTEAAKTWRTSLLNISGGNRMLDYSNLRVGTLVLDNARPAALQEHTAGGAVTLTRLFDHPDDVARAAPSLKAIANKARTAAEEHGIHTSFLATGFATWDTTRAATPDNARLGRSAPRAPVLLRPLQITPRPGTIDGYELRVTGERDLNGVLLHLLREQFGVVIDSTSLLDPDLLDHKVLGYFAKTCATSLTGFRVEASTVAANLTYTEQPLIDDLGEDRLAFLAGSDMIQALAGDPTASNTVRTTGQAVSADAPDRRAPDTEHLILDADGSQSYVINAVSAGQHLVVQGPPGTGKSQTIANVIAELVATGKTVLFVAQKRAAITAVLGRLDHVGLGHLVLDLFATGGSRRTVLEEISRAIDGRRDVPKPDVTPVHRQLVKNRDTLAGANDALHERIVCGDYARTGASY